MAWPLEGVLVVDFSQFLAGPYASLKLLDLGARVIKVENPQGGDLCRSHYISDTRIGTDSTLFHAINRGKESIALDLKAPADLDAARALVTRADVVIQNFRPGVMDRLGLGFDAAREINPDVIYGTITGYGRSGDWRGEPGQDLLAQARSGIMWLSGNASDGPVPVGLPVADISTGANLAFGLLGALFRHARTGQGAHVETSLLESLADLQFEMLTTYLNNGRIAPERLPEGSAHGYLGAPYGVFETARGFLALAMTPLDRLATALKAPELVPSAAGRDAAFHLREKIHRQIAARLGEKSASEWETELSQQNIWCARVLSWDEMLAGGSFQALDMVGPVTGPSGATPQFLRAPFRIDGARPDLRGLGPELHADGQAILKSL